MLKQTYRCTNRHPVYAGIRCDQWWDHGGQCKVYEDGVLMHSWFGKQVFNRPPEVIVEITILKLTLGERIWRFFYRLRNK